MARLPGPAQGILAFHISLRLGGQREGGRSQDRRRAQRGAIDQSVQQIEDVGLGRHAGLQGEFDSSSTTCSSCWRTRDRISTISRSPPGRLSRCCCKDRNAGGISAKGGAVAQGAGLALDHGQIMAPVIDGPAQAIVRARKHAAMLTDRLTLGDDDDPVGIDPQANRAVGEGSRHAVAIALEMDETGRGEPPRTCRRLFRLSHAASFRSSSMAY